MKAPKYDESWDEEVKCLYAHDVQEIWDANACRHVWNQYHNQLDTYLHLVTTLAHGGPLSILDVGSAQATLALILAENGHRTCAVDIRPHFLDYAKSRYTHGRIKFIAGNIFDISFDEKFDIIFANQIVEHLVYPQRLFGHLRSFMKVGGNLVVTTPNQEYFVNKLPSFSELGEPSKYESKQFTADADGHFFAYRASELLEILQAVGFVKNKVKYFESPFISGHMKIRYLHGIMPRGLLRTMDAFLLGFPKIGKIFAHQLMVVGEK